MGKKQPAYQTIYNRVVSLVYLFHINLSNEKGAANLWNEAAPVCGQAAPDHLSLRDGYLESIFADYDFSVIRLADLIRHTLGSG